MLFIFLPRDWGSLSLSPKLCTKPCSEDGLRGVGVCLPVLHSIEGFLVGDVIHEDEAHGTSIVGCSDGSVPLLSRRVLGNRQDQRGPTCGNELCDCSVQPS